MGILFIGLITFFVVHCIPMAPSHRSALILRLGYPAYKTIYSLASVLGLALMVWGYAELRGSHDLNREIWEPPPWARHITYLLLIPAFILLVAAYVPSGIRTRVRHPMLIAISLWAGGHLVSNGDIAAIALFGPFLAYSIIDFTSVQIRTPQKHLHKSTGTVLGDMLAIAIGLGLYALMLTYGHRLIVGVPLLVET